MLISVVLFLCTLVSPTLVAAAPVGKVVIAQGVDPTTLDPMNHQETPAANVAGNIFEALLERDENLRIVPQLAESYQNVAPTVWEFRLRKGVKFHNGEDVDAEAVKFSVERILDPQLNLRGAPFFTNLSHAEVVGPHTVRIHTKSPWPILDVVAGVWLPILPPKYYREKDLAHVAKNPVGSGPYKFVRWLKDEQIELEANEHYWRGAPRVRNVVFKPIPDDAVRVAALQNGEIDIAVNIPPHLGTTISTHPRLFLSIAPSVRTIQLIYYTHQFDKSHKLIGPYQGPVADARVRQAINYAVDVDAIIKMVLEGRGVRVATMLTDKHFGFDPELAPIKQDLLRTKRLLAEAGYPNGIDVILNAPQGRYVRDKEVAEALAGQLSKAGIRTTLRTHEWGNYLNNLIYVHKAGPLYLIGWGASTYDAETIYVPLFRSGKIMSNYYNADLNGMVDQAQTIMDPKRRLELYHRINRLWVEDAPAMPLYQQVDLYGVNKRVAWKARGDERLKAYDMALGEGR